MRQVLRAGALGRPRGMGWRGRWEGGSGWGTRVNPWLIHVNVWQKPLQYCKVISLLLIKINEKIYIICLSWRVKVTRMHAVMSDSFVTSWTIAPRAPLSMEFSRQEYWKILGSLLLIEHLSCSEYLSPLYEAFQCALLVQDVSYIWLSETLPLTLLHSAPAVCRLWAKC